VANSSTFERAIDREEENRGLRNKIKSFEERIAKLESRIPGEGIAAADLATEKKAG